MLASGILPGAKIGGHWVASRAKGSGLRAVEAGTDFVSDPHPGVKSRPHPAV
jgi:hypothetical protein